MSALDISLEKKLDKEVNLLIHQSQFDDRFLVGKGKITFSEFLSNKMLLILTIRSGIPYSFFSLIQRISPFNDEDWADYLNISTKSLHRYKERERPFKPIQTEKIIEMAEVTNMGLDVFGSMEKFKLWLETPNYALGNLKPIDLLKDSYGKELVISELTRINYGILG